MTKCIVNVWYLTFFFYILFLFVESVNIRVEEGVEVQTNLLENKTIIQDVFHEVNESSDKTNLNAKPS